MTSSRRRTGTRSSTPAASRPSHTHLGPGPDPRRLFRDDLGMFHQLVRAIQRFAQPHLLDRFGEVVDRVDLEGTCTNGVLVIAP